MSAVLIRLQCGVRTRVTVDGKFAYDTATHPTIEKQRIEKLLELMVIENTRVEIKE